MGGAPKTPPTGGTTPPPEETTPVVDEQHEVGAQKPDIAHVDHDGSLLNDKEYKDIIERRKLGIKQN